MDRTSELRSDFLTACAGSSPGLPLQELKQAEARRSAWEKSVTSDLAAMAGSMADTRQSVANLRQELRQQSQVRAEQQQLEEMVDRNARAAIVCNDGFAADMIDPVVEAINARITSVNARLEITLQVMKQHFDERMEDIVDRCTKISESEHRLQELLENSPKCHRSVPSSVPEDSNKAAVLATQSDELTEDGLSTMDCSMSFPVDDEMDCEKTTNAVKVLTARDSERSLQPNMWRVRTWLESSAEISNRSRDPIERCLSYLHITSFWLTLVAVAWTGVSLIVAMPSIRNGDHPPDWLYGGDLAFLAAFALELVMRLALEKKEFFTGPYKGWNAFDVVITVLQLLNLLDIIIRFSSLRLIKTLCILRASRLFRLARGLREARLIIEMATWKPLFWGVCLMFTLSYLIAVIIFEAVSHWLLHEGGVNGLRDEELMQYYGSFIDTFYTLLLAVTHAGPAGSLLKPLGKINWWLQPLFLGYMITMNITVLNMISALYFEAVTHAGNFDKMFQVSDVAIQEERLIEEQLKSLLEAADRNKDGRISRKVMLRVLDKKDGAKVLRQLKLDVTTMRALFKLADAEECDSVHIEDLCAAVQHLKAGGSNVQQAMLLFQSRRLLSRIDKLGKNTESRFRGLRSLVQKALDSDFDGRL
mmetsp:Transcript_15283/g.29555  ORF Transcript_15283/g.29555 Transcript_15283/m.29555 type:complete len:647 (+) Transcript_15283:58-1998(+)